MGEPTAGLNAAGRRHAAIDQPRATRQLAGGNTELFGVDYQCVAELVRAFVKGGHGPIVRRTGR